LCLEGLGSWRWGAGGGVEAEDAKFAGSVACSGEGGFELGRGVGFDVEEELVFPGAAVDGPAFDFLQVDAMFGERLERGEERARAVGKAHGDGHFVSAGCGRVVFGRGAEQEKAREVFGIVLDIGGQDDSGIVLGGTASGDGGGGFVAASEDFADAAGRVLGRDTLEMRVGDKKSLALGEGHRVAGDRAEPSEGGARAADEMVLDGEDGLRGDGEGAFEKEIVDADNRAGESIFDRGEERVGGAFVDGTESGVKRGTRDGGDGFAEKLDGSGFAEGAGFALESDTHLVGVDGAHAPHLGLEKIAAASRVGHRKRASSGDVTAPYDEMKTERLQAAVCLHEDRAEPHS